RLQEAFIDFSSLIQNKDDLVHPLKLDFGGTRIAIDHEDADYSAQNIRIVEGMYLFDVKTPNGILKDLKFSMPGEHNLLNALTAMTMALKAGVSTELLAQSLSTFKGVDRRLSVRYASDNKVIIEDYAHHPTELRALYKAAKTMYNKQKITLVFQPHLYSRTQDFGEEFAQSLSLFDQVLLLDIYPARELPIEGITSQWLLDKIQSTDKKLIQKEMIFDEINDSPFQVIIMAGAGDITKEVQNVVKLLEYEK